MPAVAWAISLRRLATSFSRASLVTVGLFCSRIGLFASCSLGHFLTKLGNVFFPRLLDLKPLQNCRGVGVVLTPTPRTLAVCGRGLGGQTESMMESGV